jgi:diadenosine tetraphosphate (Ap4A) HIT family hydrolase
VTNKSVDYAGNAISFGNGDCPACAYARGEFLIPCGLAYEDDVCTVSQDWQIPINGFMIVAPKRHITSLEQMTETERNHIFNIVNKVISILRNNKTANDFNVIFEEKKDVHFHVWILPRDQWKELGINPTKEIGKLFEYALANLRTKENLDAISKTNTLLKKELAK